MTPDDQQLDRYIAGEEVKLNYMTENGHERFALPDLNVRVIFAVGRTVDEARLVPDTVVIEPAERRFSLVGRVTVSPSPDLTALRTVIVGEPTRARLEALRSERRYLG